MKNLILILGMSFFALNQSAGAVEAAQYFRVWQGFRQTEMSEEKFLGKLPAFMKETVDLYQADGTLNNYLVVIPPKDKPDFIPDELALVALRSEEDYRRIRNTPEGQRYSERHWDVFNKESSSSARHFVDYTREQPQQLNHNWSYDMIGEAIDWAEGVNFAFIGTRKEGVSKENFLRELKTHVELAKEIMPPKGLRGYIIIANENYEVAYLNWESKEAHDAAVASEGGQEVFKDAQRFMQVIFYDQAPFFSAGNSVENAKAYSTVSK